MGLPTVAMGTLGLVMAPVQAAALLVIPSLVTNVWQFVAGPSKGIVIRRFASMMLFVCLGTAIGIRFLTSGSSHWPSLALGSVLAAYAAIALFLPAFKVSQILERRLSPVIGGLTGLLAGATGVFVVPAVPYLSALGLNRDELVQALGLSFTVSTVALAIALGFSGIFSPAILVTSVVAVAPAFAGMFLGQRTRDRIDPTAFRRWFLVAMFLVGAYMVVRSVIADI
jgi:uncharacterized membrane protein YfcA